MEGDCPSAGTRPHHGGCGSRSARRCPGRPVLSDRGPRARSALITGAAGQDGLILAHLLERDGFVVHGLVKPGTDATLLRRYAPSASEIQLDLGNVDGLRRLIVELRPDQVFNLGGFTAPAQSWEHEAEVRRVNVDAVAAIVDALRTVGSGRLFQASSAAIFEGVDRYPQDEGTEPSPLTPYAQSKLDAMRLVQEARDRDGVFGCVGILYNHESPLRSPNFVTRKVTMAVARIAAGQQEHLELGNLEGARDWGWAPDVVRGMRLAADADQASDFVFASGISHRLSFFVRRAFEAIGVQEWERFVVTTRDNMRPVDTNRLVGNSGKAARELGWRPLMDFDDMVRAMVDHDCRLLQDPDALWTDFTPGSTRRTAGR